MLVSGWVREGHPASETTRLATEIAAAVTQIAAVAGERGHVLPEPGLGYGIDTDAVDNLTLQRF